MFHLFFSFFFFEGMSVNNWWGKFKNIFEIASVLKKKLLWAFFLVFSYWFCNDSFLPNFNFASVKYSVNGLSRRAIVKVFVYFWSDMLLWKVNWISSILDMGLMELEIFDEVRRMNIRQLLYQGLNFAMIVSSALMIWKGLMVVTGSESPIVVVLSGSMEPAFFRQVVFGLLHNL